MKINFNLFIIVLVTISSYSQKNVKFNAKVNPSKTYFTTTTSVSYSEVDFIADESILQQFVIKGILLPMIVKDSTVTPLTLKTFQLLKNGTFNAVMEYGEIFKEKINNGKIEENQNLFSGIKILGSYDIDRMFNIDTVIGTTDDFFKASISNTIKQIQKSIKFPNEPLSIGDSFENNIPMTFPIQGMNPINIKIKTNYTLTNITDNIAHFDIENSITMDMQQSSGNMKAEGIGHGKAEYTINEMYLTKYQTRIPINLTMKLNDEMTMILKSESKINTETIISDLINDEEYDRKNYFQILNCSDFKTGKFYVPVSDTESNRNLVIRKDKTQIEYKGEVEKENKKHEIIDWIDDCTYRLTYDASKMELDEHEIWINENNGIIVKNKRINGKCMIYEATLTTNDGKELKQSGKICKY